jgi:hypothetical protein
MRNAQCLAKYNQKRVMSARVAVVTWIAIMTLLKGTRILFKTSALSQKTLPDDWPHAKGQTYIPVIIQQGSLQPYNRLHHLNGGDALLVGTTQSARKVEALCTLWEVWWNLQSHIIERSAAILFIAL